MATFSEVKTGLDAISNRIQNASQRVSAIKSDATFVVNDLTNLGVENTALITAINQAAASSPSDVALQNAKAEAALLVAEYNALKTKANAILAAAQ